MTKHNELIIDGVHTSSFNYDIAVEEHPAIVTGERRTKLLEHDGLSGAILQSNPNRSTIEKKFTLHLFNPSEQERDEFLALLAKENFWLEQERVKNTRLWCYTIKVSEMTRKMLTLWDIEVTFICHPTRYLKTTDTQTLNTNGVLRLQGSAPAFPKITITGNSTSETYFTIGDKTIRLENLQGLVVMTNDPKNPSFKKTNGQPIRWRGDFLTIEPAKAKTLGVVFGPGIASIKFETDWGWS